MTSLGYDAIQNKKISALLLMGFRKVFDTVSHKILLQKLYHYGIRGPAYSFIESYLANRKQFVSINNNNSLHKPINIGVPQGSILRPLFYIVYVNDNYTALSCKPRLFADDTCFFSCSPTLSDLEQECNAELLNLRIWCDANRLQINPDKSAAIIIPPKLNNPMPSLNLLYDNKLITCEELSKYLGVTIDYNLNFMSHIHTTVSKIARSVGILNKLQFILPPPTLLLLYYFFIHPHLLFGLPICGSSCPTYLAKLQQLQNKAIPIISNSFVKTPITPQFYKLSVLKIHQLYEFEIVKLMHQQSRNMLSSTFNSLFQNLFNKHTRQATATTIIIYIFPDTRPTDPKNQ